MTSDSMSDLQSRIGYKFTNIDLLQQAITHKSFHNENPGSSKGHNERLEFLGDAVLDLVLSEKLFLDHQDWTEGELSKVRSSLANETALAEIARDLQLGNDLLFGKGESQTGGALKPRLLASGLEALIAAVYLDTGFDAAKAFVLRLAGDRLDKLENANLAGFDFKTRLQETTQEKFRKIPVYELIGEDGPDHDKVFTVHVKVEDRVLAEGKGKSKKQAEQEAAAKALEKL